MFFLPPPHRITLQIFLLYFEIVANNLLAIILLVKSVIVEAPSSKSRPLKKFISKSFTSKEFILLAGIFSTFTIGVLTVLTYKSALGLFIA